MTGKGSPQASAVDAGIAGKPGTGIRLPADGRPPAGGPLSTRGRALAAAGLGAACLSASAILIKLANTGPATAAFYRCFLALPVLRRPLAGRWPPAEDRPSAGSRMPVPGLPAIPASTALACGDPLPVMTVLAYGADMPPTLRERADRSQNAFGADGLHAAGRPSRALGAARA